MKMCKVCGKPIPRTKKLCEECEKGAPPLDPVQEEVEEKEEKEEDEFAYGGDDED